MSRYGGVFDYEATMQRLDGDVELLEDLVRFFLEDSPRLLEEVQTGMAAQNSQAVVHGSHTLKGLAANFGAEQAVQAALGIERLAGTGQLAAAVDLIPKLEQEILQLQEALRAFSEGQR